MRFVIRPSDIEHLIDLLRQNPYTGIGILCFSMLLIIIVTAITASRKKK